MLDVTLIRNHPDQVRDALRKRAVDPDIPGFLALDTAFREARTAVERLRGERRRISAEIAVRRRTDAPADEVQAQAKTLTDELAEAEAHLAELAVRHQEFLDALPNLPDDDVVAGGKENNEVVRAVGEAPAFDFPARGHVELAQDLGLVDYKRGAALAGNGYWIYRGEGAALEWALLSHFLDAHRRAGYEFVLPPHLLTYEAGYTAGQFPKFADEVFRVDEHFLLPTAETALVNLHRGETLDEGELPRRYVAYTPCYRRESGSHRRADRGTLRGHQFNKVELFQFARPQDSDAAHLELLARAEELVAGLGLHYRVTKLAAGDTSPAQAKTYDVEVWLPSLGAYAEVSSVSNARAYQARRGGIRYRPAGGGKATYLHTLNASGLATSRLLPAILEQHQRADGTVAVPEVLRRWGLPEVLRPRATSA
ncbi:MULTISPECIES: serine--tRNA ligase [unclassified Streptomyces]|uniref:serine--tRNA ligase n=1 Tax=unclassified Streptomyces TaxID=2593676 RepID=UPI0023663F2D|nr:MULTISPECIES: serine--tRNA ligase [unclassified Streptomyces]MDF3142572.1 serine--tRNA ligase [Streptomyces sp. T21Q-yed]WDF38632.1 serine--tRNA ligase [Streptomyces sp. T12]